MDVKDFYYDLPQELIAQDPLEDRSSSRLLVLNKETGEMEHTDFKHIINYLNPEDCLVLNNTKVIPARLFGEKEGTQAKIEILLLKRKENDIWETLVKPGKKAKPGTKIIFGQGLLVGEVLEVVEDGNRLIQFSYEGIFEEILDQLGQMPLPPYITHQLKDKNRYQTVYAKYDGSAAAPTAGLHFTPELLEQIKEKGIRIAEVTLHVGLGTFRPVKVENVQDHHMHSEFYMVTQEAADIINDFRRPDYFIDLHWSEDYILQSEYKSYWSNVCRPSWRTVSGVIFFGHGSIICAYFLNTESICKGFCICYNFVRTFGSRILPLFSKR